MTLPNFFVIGAQKCGTTALYSALKQHPQIFMSPIKEPRFFAFPGQKPDFRGPGSDLFNIGLTTDLTVYAALFNDADGYLASGEASPIYLSSYQPEKTAQQLHAILPHARIIALLRQPAERAWSAFLHHRRLGIEPLHDFRKALEQETMRKAQGWYPGWRYWENGLYADNLSPYFSIFERRQIRVYLYEEWNNKPETVLTDIFEFLEVDSNFHPNLDQRHNVSLVPRSRNLQHLIQTKYPNSSNRLITLLSKLNQTHPNMPRALHKDLTLRYAESIKALENLLDRKLTRWKT